MQQVTERNDELFSMQAMSGVLCDVTFKLTSTLRFVGSDRFRDAFFGRALEDSPIVDLMSVEDKNRFMSFIDRMLMTQVPGTIPLTLKRRRGSAEVKLFLVEVHKSSIAEDPKFLVSLMVSREVLNEESTAHDSGDTSVTLPSTVSTMPGLEGFDPIVPHRPDSDLISDLSFTYTATDSASCSAARSQRPALDGVSNDGGRSQLHTTVVINAQSSEDATVVASASSMESAMTHEVAVNTTCVWRQDTFVCATCAKPPKLPGPLPKLPRSANKRQMKRQQNQYKGTEFDGCWALREEGSADVPGWLRHLNIEGHYVVLGDLTTTTIVMGESDECILRSGLIWIEDDGTLLRKGHSGRLLHYDRIASSDSEDDLNDTASVTSIQLV
eukprot:TRINITY_DN25538_c0_g1_i1.p1 TRINITY_DN25538_c0_g1~~TRINITY_DN25538_c0_g1_i1.p1  ORF type:complete len:395 (+),score=22.21 TRINITY_DN25538_c0_g1_i1:35-1186(+)